MKHFRILLLLLLAAQLFTTGCRKEDEPASATSRISQVPSDWYRLSLQMTRQTSGYTPPVAARKTYDWEVVANASLAHACRKLYPNASVENAQNVNNLDNYWHNTLSAGIPSDVSERSRQFGIAVAEAVFAYATSDGQYECHLNNFPD